VPVSTTEQPLDLYTALGAALIARDVVRVSGPDAIAYLQGQLSQDVEDLDVGATTWSFVLQPAGKVDAWVRVTRTGGDAVVLDVDGGAGEALTARLRRFLLRTKAEVEQLDWRCVALRGPGAEVAASKAAVESELRVPAGWPAVEGVDLFGPDVALPPDVAAADADAYEAQRLTAGVPAMGAELTERTIPAEAGQWLVDVSVDFTKGCFTGQELVARIDSRGGNVPRRLRGLVLDGPAPVPPGAGVVRADAEAEQVVGEVTSSIYSPALGAAVALAYVGRAVEPPADVEVVWPGGQRTAEVRTLPLVGPAG
jgi:folate-binding protein YgfZ